ncbi:MAG: phosphate ABC transporter permease PstA [Prolixibacteraceae bacterium]|nr:phosphate ABC transporter permease PstA [Bacteroidota bacterium]OQB78545.1 MAG: Phosphate transport system permease protein PstA [Bacteroidetes bacterium ADurb.Bin123]HOC87865.1 phosphate ABC transporter permease PstA [Prolixibacteraceae bacterium]HOF56552.1 phosphate ABC transporter permease PstA [Prolixibacteraceae bacterium]HOG97214.1 phosphate ABC transporter permease PstA [Prolixibacteraceae bacterium]
MNLMKSDNRNTPDRSSWRDKKNKLFLGLVVTLSIVTVLPIFLILWKLVKEGISQINLDFFIKVAPDPLEAMTAVNNGEIIPGGIANGITGSLLMVLIASLIAIPVSILAGIFLYEHPNGWYARLIRNLTDILQGVPSIVLGLIAYIWIVISITKGFSGLAGSVALAIMMLPIVIRSTEETMKMIPVTLKEAAAALGVPYWRIILKVMIPTGFSGLMTGILLSISRILGETAPLMLTALGSTMINLNIYKPTSAVPLLIWEFYNNPNMVRLVWSSSLFLMGVVLVLNILAKRINSRFGNNQ